MEKFIVSARKYRPQTFDSVIGQEHITTTLKNAIRNEQLAHAFLFCGPRGVGKTTCARILAKTINCDNRTEDQEACDQCASCLSFLNASSLNIHELDAASNNSVDDIRELVDHVRYMPQEGKYKVYIIDEVHMLSAQAFNAFLKTLEEPPPYAIFILATTEKHKIIPTILSRCQIFDFKRITINDTVEHLESICKKENIETDKAALQVIAQKSEGCMRDALSLMDKIVSFTNGNLEYSTTLEHLNILDEDYYFRLLDLMQEQNLPEVLLTFNDINRKGFDGEIFLVGFAEFFRNLLVSYDKKSLELLDVVEGFKTRYASAASKTDPGFVITAMNILNEGEINLKSARNKRLQIELLLIKLTYLNQAVQLETGENKPLSKKKLTDNTKPVMFRALPVIEKKNEAARKDKIQEEKNKSTFESPVKKTESLIDPQPLVVATIENQASEPEQKKPVSKVPESTRIGTEKKLNLTSLRERVGKQLSATGTALPLEIGAVKEVWEELISLLKEAKNPAYISFISAELEIIDEINLKITGATAWDMKVIENERRLIAEKLQEKFQNRSLNIVFAYKETGVIEEERPLSKKEQYNQMAEKYPLIKDLKDRLGLELDY